MTNATLQVYQVTNPLCKFQDAPTSEFFTTQNLTHTLTSVSGHMACSLGYNLQGHSKIDCDENGKLIILKHFIAIFKEPKWGK